MPQHLYEPVAHYQARGGNGDIDYDDFFAVGLASDAPGGGGGSGRVGVAAAAEDDDEDEHINESTAFVSNNYRRFSPAYRQRKNRWSPEVKGKGKNPHYLLNASNSLFDDNWVS